MYMMIREVASSLLKLKLMREEGRKIAIETLKEIGKPAMDPSTKGRPLLRVLHPLPKVWIPQASSTSWTTSLR